MYGIKFLNHPNLRRFYMPEDFVDPHTGEPLYPLRKDFPLMGLPDSLPLPPYPERDGEVI
jgi:NADH-quinone oxidoreductase subunit C